MRVLEGGVAAALLAIVIYDVSGKAPSQGSNAQPANDTAKVVSAAEDDTPSPSITRSSAQEGAWDAEQRKVARSWLEGYCEWAWAHDLSVFPSVSTVKNQIITDDHSDAVVRFSLAGRERKGRCGFTTDGRAVPQRSRESATFLSHATEEQSAANEASSSPKPPAGRRPRTGALIDGLVYAPPLPASEEDGAAVERAWFPVLLLSLHGEPLHGIHGYLPKYAYHSHSECMDGTRRGVTEMALAGVRGRFLCMYHGESDRQISRLPMESFGAGVSRGSSPY